MKVPFLPHNQYDFYPKICLTQLWISFDFSLFSSFYRLLLNNGNGNFYDFQDFFHLFLDTQVSNLRECLLEWLYQSQVQVLKESRSSVAVMSGPDCMISTDRAMDINHSYNQKEEEKEKDEHHEREKKNLVSNKAEELKKFEKICLADDCQAGTDNNIFDEKNSNNEENETLEYYTDADSISDMINILPHEIISSVDRVKWCVQSCKSLIENNSCTCPGSPVLIIALIS